MYFCFCGPPSARSTFVSRVGLQLLREKFGNIPFVYANAGRDLLLKLREVEESRAVLYFDFPDSVVSRVISENRIPTVLVAEPFEDIVAHCMAVWGMDLQAAVRFTSRSLAQLHALGKLASVHRVRPSGEKLTLAELADGLCRYFGFQADADMMKRLTEAFDPEGSLYVDVLVEGSIETVANARALLEGMSAEQRHLIAQTAEGYDALVSGRDRCSFMWPGELFFRVGEPQPVAGPIDLIGPARILSFGPYLHLPAGEWRAEMRFQVVGSLSRNGITMEVTEGLALIVSGQRELPSSGVYSMHIPFRVSNPEEPIQVRSVLPSGAIEGRFRLLEIVIESAGSALPGG